MAITEHDLGSVIGPAGPQGPAGPAGAQGAEGKTPSIGANGHWFVGDRDTGIMGDASKAVAAKIVNSLATTQAGYALDARQGKVLDGKIASLNSALTSLNGYLQGAIIDTGYKTQPYYFHVPIGSQALVIASDASMWLIQSGSDFFAATKASPTASAYTFGCNINDRVVTVRRSDGASNNVRLIIFNTTPVYK